MIQIMKGGTIQYELVPQDVELSLIFNQQKLNLDNQKLSMIHNQTTKLFLKAESLKISYSQNGPVDNDILKYTRLIRFLNYFLNKKLPTISEEELDLLEYKLPKSYLIGMEKISKLIKDKFLKFTDNQVKSKPKGVVFYGPPRTGKSAISAECIDILRLFKVFTDITPADFNNELQGQAEKMLNNICQRTEIIPWQLCILFLDEIDGIAPQRSTQKSQGSKIDLTNLFLTIIEGNKKKSNLLIWGTTNRLEDMDKAFRDRLDIKIFHGIPNFETRKKFYDYNVNIYGKNEKFKDLCTHEMQNTEIYNYVQQNTINFSSDALLQSMESIILKLNQNLQQIRNGSLNARELIKEILKESAISYSNYFGSQVIPLLPNKEEIKENYSKDLLQTIQCFFNSAPINQEFKLNSTPIILIDLKEEWDQQVQFMVYRNDQIQSTNQQTNSLLEFGQLKNKFLKLKEDKQNLIDSYFYKRYLLQKKLKFTKAVLEVQKNKDFNKFQVALELATNIINLFKQTYNNQFAFSQKFSLVQIKGLNVIDFYQQMQTNPDQVDVLKAFDVLEIVFNEQTVEVLKKIFCKPLFEKPEQLKNLLSKKNSFYFCLMLALEFNLDYVDLIDEHYFSNKSFLTDEHIQFELNGLVKEREQYTSGILIFDLSSLARIQKNYSQLSQDLIHSCPSAYQYDKNNPGFNYEIKKPETYYTVLNKISEHFHNNILINSDKRHLFIIISDQNKLTLDFKEQCNWLPTPSQLEAEKKIEEECNEQLVCARCNKHYSIQNNNQNECSRHYSNEFYRQSQFDLITQLANQEDENSNDNQQQKLYKQWLLQQPQQVQLDDRYSKKMEKKNYVEELLKKQLKTYTYDQAKQQIQNSPWLAEDFRYTCCQRRMGDEGQIICEHSTTL